MFCASSLRFESTKWQYGAGGIVVMLAEMARWKSENIDVGRGNHPSLFRISVLHHGKPAGAKAMVCRGDLQMMAFDCVLLSLDSTTSFCVNINSSEQRRGINSSAVKTKSARDRVWNRIMVHVRVPSNSYMTRSHPHIRDTLMRQDREDCTRRNISPAFFPHFSLSSCLCCRTHTFPSGLLSFSYLTSWLNQTSILHLPQSHHQTVSKARMICPCQFFLPNPTFFTSWPTNLQHHCFPCTTHNHRSEHPTSTILLPNQSSSIRHTATLHYAHLLEWP